MKDNNRLQVENNELDYMQDVYRLDIDRLRRELAILERELKEFEYLDDPSYDEKLYIINIKSQIEEKRRQIRDLDHALNKDGYQLLVNEIAMDEMERGGSRRF